MSTQQTFADKMLDRIKAHFGAQRVLWLDIETFSECDIKDCGAARYAEHPSTEIILGAYSFDNGPVKFWDKYAHTIGQTSVPTDTPAEVLEAFNDKKTLIVAHNAAFEFCLFKYAAKTPINPAQLMDPMIQAYYLSFPGQLDKIGKIIGVAADAQKDSGGKALIRRFSVPAKPLKRQPDRTRIWPKDDPEKWQQYRDYNRQDVVAMREIAYHLFKYPMPRHEWKNWRHDLLLNDRGIPVNKKMAEAGVKLYEEAVERGLAQLRDITGLANPNSNVQLLGWLSAQGDYPFRDMRKASVTRALAMPLSEKTVRVLKLRQLVSQTSAKKFYTFRDACCDDGTIKYSLQFGGAQRTLRWGGRLIQPQNLKSPSAFVAENMPEIAANIEQGNEALLDSLYPDYDILDLLSEAMRGIIQAPEGHILVDADLSAIENVVLGYVANEDKILSVFREGRDPYLDFAQYMFKQPYDELFHEYKVLGNGKKRKTAKPAVLGAGYRLGAGHRYIDEDTGQEEATGLLGYAAAMGIKLTDEEAAESVRVWRETYTQVVQCWYDLEEAAKEVVEYGGTRTVGHVSFSTSGPFLRIKLPGERHLNYYKPVVQLRMPPWGKDQSDLRPTLTYWGLKEGVWRLLETHGGKLCLAEGTLVLAERGWTPIENVTTADRVWDGVGWVTHHGLADNGTKHTIELDGVEMTPDHLVLSTAGWSRADETKRLDRVSARLPDGSTARRKQQIWQAPVGVPLCVREHGDDACGRTGHEKNAPRQVLRMQTAGVDLGGELNAPEIHPSDVCGVSIHATALREPGPRSISQLRGTWDFGGPAMGDVRAVLRRHSAIVRARPRIGSARQQRTVLPGELPVGHSESELQQQTKQLSGADACRGDDRFGRRREVRRPDKHGVLPGATGPTNHRRVYDLVNCGPRNRFVVLGKRGPFLVHNCENIVQAIARDILVHGQNLARSKGIDLRLHVHDQNVAVARIEDGERIRKELDWCMSQRPSWAPDIPLRTGSLLSTHFTKE